MFRDITHAICANALTPRKTQSSATAILCDRSARPFVKLHPGIVSVNESANEYTRKPTELAAEKIFNPESDWISRTSALERISRFLRELGELDFRMRRSFRRKDLSFLFLPCIGAMKFPLFKSTATANPALSLAKIFRVMSDNAR